MLYITLAFDTLELSVQEASVCTITCGPLKASNLKHHNVLQKYFSCSSLFRKKKWFLYPYATYIRIALNIKKKKNKKNKSVGFSLICKHENDKLKILQY